MARSQPTRTKQTKKTALSSSSTRTTKAVTGVYRLEVAGLACIAFGVFLGFVSYFGWEGGKVGHFVLAASRISIGIYAYALPVVLLTLGATLIVPALCEKLLRSKIGIICLSVALFLLGASGVFSNSNATRGWQSGWLESHAGAIGEALYWCIAKVAGPIGVGIVSVFLTTIAAVSLLELSLSGLIHSLLARRRRPVPATKAADKLRQNRKDHGQPTLPTLDGKDDTVVVKDFDDTVAISEPIETAAINAPDSFSNIEEFAPEDPGELFEQDDTGVSAPIDVDPADLTPQGRYRSEITESPDFPWRLPATNLLKRSSGGADRPDEGAQKKVAEQLVEALGHFGIKSQVVGMVAGPHISRYELRLAPGIKVAKVAALKDDLAYALAAADIRILAPIPGKQAVGVEVPNTDRRIVHVGDIYSQAPADWSPLTVWLGKDVAGRAIAADLAKMPHILVAGTTGAGKSACINSMLSSILLRATPHEVRMVLIDPKQVELNHYESIPHLLTPVITSPKKASFALSNLVREMEQRYSYMSIARTRTLNELNRVRARRSEPPLPYILCVIDELADLMMVAPGDVEDAIIRLAQKARAVGIHLVLATQSPRVDVITGMIKANVPSRIAFAVSSQTDSRVILDQNGAESLLGQGDMLFSPVGSSKLQRIQGAYITEEEIAGITEDWRRQGEPEFQDELLEEAQPETEGTDRDGLNADADPLLGEAIRLVAEMQTASTSMLQRRMRLGYTRAGRMIDMLERRSVISGYEGSKPRQVLITESDLPRVLALHCPDPKGEQHVHAEIEQSLEDNNAEFN